MKKILLFLVVLFIFASAPPALACWMPPVSFEVFSEDGTSVFVFNPDAYDMDQAYAAVYIICNSISDQARQVLYTVEDLSSFAYENNFYFSSDMNHFARMFNPSGLPIFEVFSYGIRTRTVLRSDIIQDYASGAEVTSIGSIYTVNWTIEYFSPQDAILTISTEEGNTFLFDLVSAAFITEDVPSGSYETSPELSIELPTESPVESSPESLHETRATTLIVVVLVILITGILIVLIVLSRCRKWHE